MAPVVPIGLGQQRGEFCELLNGRVVSEHEVQHRHEVRFARAEAAVEVGTLAGVRLQAGFDEVQRLSEALRQLRRDDVVLQRLLRVAETFGEAENEVPLPHLIRQVDEVFEVGHGINEGELPTNRTNLHELKQAEDTPV